MKLSLLTLLAITGALVAANPVAVPDAGIDIAEVVKRTEGAELEKRASCRVYNAGINSWPGTCVDVRKGNQCKHGLLVTGFCEGGNTIICCIKDQWLGLWEP